MTSKHDMTQKAQHMGKGQSNRKQLTNLKHEIYMKEYCVEQEKVNQT